MKNLSLSVILALSFLIANAQPQFTANHCFQVNDSSTLGFAVVNQSFDNFIPLTGNNYTWDFSNTGSHGPWINWTSPTTSYKFQPSTQSIHRLFGASEINEHGDVAFARDHFYTYSPIRDTLFLDGFYNTSNKYFSPHLPYLTFPLSFSDSVYTKTIQTGGTGLGPGIITRYWVYDGFGTIKMPFGTEINVYRIRTRQIDSSTVVNLVTADTEELIWFRQLDGIPMLRFVKQGSLIAAYYTSVYVASREDVSALDTKLLIYPNPFTTQIMLSNFTGKNILLINIYDAFGKRVWSEANFNFNEINTSKLKNGTYNVEIIFEDNQIIRRKLVKQRADR